MTNPNEPIPPVQSPTGQTLPQPPSSNSTQSDLPPLPPDFQNTPIVPPAVTPVTTTTTTTTTSAPPSSDGASSTGPEPIASPVTVSPKKKFGGGRIIATILGLFLLVGGIGAGIVLTQNQQLFQQKAAGLITPLSIPAVGCNTTPCANGYRCQNNQCVPNTSLGCRRADPGAPVCCTSECSPGDIVTEPPCRTECKTSGANGTKWCTISAPGCGQKTPPPSGNISASCQGTKAYSSSYVELTPAQISKLKSGDTVNFCVSGTTNAGNFDKGKFTINGVAQAETTTKRPGTNDFCQSYVIKLTDTTVHAVGQIHHITLGWEQ